MTTLVEVALVGIARSPTSAATTGTDADQLVDRIPEVTPERALLLRAGILATLRRAGSRPLMHRPAPRSDPETASVISPRAAALVDPLLRGEQTDPELLVTALLQIGGATRLLRPEHLPAALGFRTRALRKAARPTLGARGRWLATLRPEWRWVLEADDGVAELPADLDRRWEDGTTGEREALLASAFRADPARARALLSRNWASEKADVRQAWLELLAPHVEPSDGVLLESWLGDRSAQIRRQVARLLWRLPAWSVATQLRTELLARISAGRAGLLGRIGAGLAGGPSRRLEVQLPPEKWPEAWEKLGLVEQPPSGTGRRQWWLRQLLEAVPPSALLAHLSSTPEELVAMARVHDLAPVLLGGLTSSAVRHGETALAVPLWDAWGAIDDTAAARAAREVLVSVLPGEAAGPRLKKLLEAEGGVELLVKAPLPWPEEVGRALLASAREGVNPHGDVLLPLAALAVPVSLLGEPLPQLPPVEKPDWRERQRMQSRESFETRRSLRWSLAQALSEER